jgi:uncharacterized Ntn-hydrolase superfamily protein
MTFSIVARCTDTGQFGVAISSSSPAVAARCAHVRAGVGAVATQNVTNPLLGPSTLDRLAVGIPSGSAVAEVVATDSFAAYRQVLAIDAAGETAVHSGANALGVWASASGADCAAGGNLLADPGVPAAMVAAFATSAGPLGHRLLAALQAGVDAGGEAGPVHSAGLLIADRQRWPYVDLRVDWLDPACPVAALSAIWAVYGPQADDYVTRALNPAAAPGFPVDTER